MRGLLVLLVACDGCATLSMTKPALRRCADTTICPLGGDGPAPPRCPDGEFCNQLTIRFESEPAGFLCGTGDDEVDCTFEFAVGTPVTLAETHVDFSRFCPIVGCGFGRASGTVLRPCEEPFMIAGDTTVSFTCRAP